MPQRARPDDKVHSALTDGSPLCGIREWSRKPASNWREVTCMSCLCEMVDHITARVERTMDGPWSGQGRPHPIKGYRKPKREQLKGDWED